ncbi:hypothetical protein GH714_015327 [Hevea brasiliensis]|uniref:Cytochrome P450 n=1 Tax=Hevea brasiliensis TaxID=3981 RepID=A0A6A6KR95_HEVBR|nr:hypothetical protein GH714_015327 [Hevea brasiliensis]
MVVSSPSAVEECLTTNDIVFANRPPLTMAKYVAYNCTTIGTVSYGNHWRNLRRISTLEIFSSNRLNVFTGIRRDEIKIFLNKLYSVSSHDFDKVELKPMLMELTFNIIMRMVAGKRYYGEEETGKNKAEAKEFREMIAEEMLFAGTESSAVTLEWAMSNLLNHPQVLEKARNELELNVGEETFMNESDLSKLPYLQNIISETLRLYPAGPLLTPHLSSQECSVGGYHVQPNTVLLVNAWAIHRDPELWDDAVVFKPERFECTPGNKFLPFGLGRRSCPGTGLANRVVGFALGSMIHGFEWKRASDEEIDMSEGVGLTMPKAKSLEAMCKARNIMKKVLSSPL